METTSYIATQGEGTVDAGGFLDPSPAVVHSQWWNRNAPMGSSSDQQNWTAISSLIFRPWFSVSLGHARTIAQTIRR